MGSSEEPLEGQGRGLDEAGRGRGGARAGSKVGLGLRWGQGRAGARAGLGLRWG